MRLSFVITAAAVSSAAARFNAVPIVRSGLAADSALGMKVLSHARRVEDEAGEEEQEQIDITWVSGYSLKFQGCHHVQQVGFSVFDRCHPCKYV